MKSNIIHLKHRADRLEILTKELKQQQISDYQIWDGIIDEELPSRGISKAHKQIIRFAKNEKLPEVLIAEDDIHFTSRNSFNYFLNNKPKEYDIYLGGIIWGKIKKDNSTDDFSGNTLYLANERFYDVLLSLPEDKDFDRAVANKGRFFVCKPIVVVQHNGFSDNQKKYMDFGPYVRRLSLYTH